MGGQGGIQGARGPWGSQKGAAAVEFAIVFPLLILLIFATIEFGLYLFNRQVITNACREGARAGVIVRMPRLSDAEIAQVVQDFSAQHLVTFGTAPVLIVNLNSGRCMTFGCELAVQADFVYDFLFLSTIGIGPLNIQGLARMRME
jgi:Flp pilus assembly protein TadG